MADWIHTKLLRAKRNAKEVFRNETGEVNIVTIVVLIGIAVMLALAFREQIVDLLARLFRSIGNSADEAASGFTIR